MSIPNEIKLEDGRTLTLREIDPADMLDLIEAAGSAMKSASSSAWLGYASMVCTVTAIDGVPVMMPATKDDVKDLARRVGNAGMVELNRALYPDVPDEPSPGSVDESLAVAKN